MPVSSFYAGTLRGCHLLRDVPDLPPGNDLAWLIDLVARGVLQVDRQGPMPRMQATRVRRDLEDRTVLCCPFPKP